MNGSSSRAATTSASNQIKKRNIMRIDVVLTLCAIIFLGVVLFVDCSREEERLLVQDEIVQSFTSVNAICFFKLLGISKSIEVDEELRVGLWINRCAVQLLYYF